MKSKLSSRLIKSCHLNWIISSSRTIQTTIYSSTLIIWYSANMSSHRSSTLRTS